MDKIMLEIISDMQQQKNERQFRTEENVQRLRNAFPVYDALITQSKKLEIAYATAENETEQSKIAKESDALEEQIQAWLTENNFPTEAVKYSPNCSKCFDTGYVNQKICSCVASKWLPLALAKAGLSHYADYSLDGTAFLDGTMQAAELKGVYSALKKYAARYPDIKQKNLVLSGGFGVGKSVAVAALGKELLLKGFSVRMLSSFEMHTAFLNYHTAPMSEKNALLSALLSPDFLIIDDLGAEPIFKNVSLEYLLMLLTTRSARGKGTAFTTNLSPDGADSALSLASRYGERIASRLLDKQTCYCKRLLAAEDLRKKRRS